MIVSFVKGTKNSALGRYLGTVPYHRAKASDYITISLPPFSP